MTMLDYAVNETRDFTDYSFHDADAVAFAMLSYDRIPASVPRLDAVMNQYGSFSKRLQAFNWRNFIESTRALVTTPFVGPSMRQVENDIAAWEREHPNEIDHNIVGETETAHKFYREISRNPRFSVTRISAAEELFDSDKQTQFAAMTFLLPTNTLVVAFRGTDDSLVGWKEDFNMAYTFPVPAQKQAADYLEKIGALWNGNIVVTGHSKGGNLAIYAAMNAPDAIKERISRVYCLDGPGFPENVVNSPEYQSIVAKIIKMVPTASIIGMILYDAPDQERIVVESTDQGLMQHSCYTWLMRGDHFVHADDLSAGSKTFQEALGAWLAGLTQRQREHAVNGLFRVLESSGLDTITDMMHAGPRVIPEILGGYAGLSGEERNYINQVLWILATSTLRRD